MPEFNVGDKVELQADSSSRSWQFTPYEITFVGKEGYVYLDKDGDEGYESHDYLESAFQIAKPPVPVKGETWAWNDRNGNEGLGPVTIRISEDDVVVYSYTGTTTPYAFPMKAFMENFDKVTE